jgi:hypothetical protein
MTLNAQDLKSARRDDITARDTQLVKPVDAAATETDDNGLTAARADGLGDLLLDLLAHDAPREAFERLLVQASSKSGSLGIDVVSVTVSVSAMPSRSDAAAPGWLRSSSPASCVSFSSAGS